MVRVRQVALHVDDLDRAVAFYELALAQPVAARFDPPGLAFFALGPTRLLLEAGAPAPMLYLGVDDVRETVERLRADGVAIESEPHVIFRHDSTDLGTPGSEEWMAFFKDSEGNLVGLVSELAPS